MSTEIVTARVPASTRHLARAAAEESGVTLSSFTRQALEERADRVLGIDRADHPAEEEGDGED